MKVFAAGSWSVRPWIAVAGVASVAGAVALLVWRSHAPPSSASQDPGVATAPCTDDSPVPRYVPWNQRPIAPPATWRGPAPRGDTRALPPWFGDPSAAPVAITGVVHGTALPTKVRLAIDAPDPGVWAGVEVETDARGRFDFGAHRPGPYLVQAFGPTETSRVMSVDVRDGAPLDVFAYACRRIEGWVSNAPWATRAVPDAAAVRLELAGRVVATTTVDGKFAFCAPRDRTFVLAHGDNVQGGLMLSPEAADRPHQDAPDDYTTSVESVVAIEGVVRDRDGRPLAGVGVQPIRDTGIDHFPYDSIDAIATTDAGGRFLVQARPGHYGFRLHGPDGRRDLLDPIVITDAGGTVALTAPSGPAGDGFDFLPGRPEGDPHGAWLRGRITHDGRPVPDAALTGTVLEHAVVWSNETGRSRADGTFALHVRSDLLHRPARYELEVAHAGLALDGFALPTIAPGGTYEVDIALSPYVPGRTQAAIVAARNELAAREDARRAIAHTRRSLGLAAPRSSAARAARTPR